MENNLMTINLSNQKNEIETSLSTTVDNYQNQLNDFLTYLHLPSNNILVDLKERKKVIVNIPDIVDEIPTTNKDTSFYISKFIAASGAGLFDAALNYIWNETVVSLRKKIELFDLEYFKSTLSDEKRKKISYIDDLKLIDDNDIILGCLKIGILSDIGYRHIDYIRNMRNWVSAAHPNQVELTGLNLCDWLETCIKEVIGKSPSKPAIQVKQLLTNLRTNIYKEDDIESIARALQNTPEELVVSLFQTVFGMFCDPNGKIEAKNNIRLIAKYIWSLLPEEQKKEVGIKYAQWSINGDIQRKNASKEFLETVDGLSYLTEDELVVELSEAVKLLHDTHFGYNNFYNEPSFAKLIKKYIPINGEIPDSICSRYVRILVLCRIGNRFGVSNLALPIYDELIGKFRDKEIKTVLCSFEDIETKSELQNPSCQKEMRNILTMITTHTSNTSLLRAMDFFSKLSDKQLSIISDHDDYKRLISSLVVV